MENIYKITVFIMLKHVWFYAFFQPNYLQLHLWANSKTFLTTTLEKVKVQLWVQGTGTDDLVCAFHKDKHKGKTLGNRDK